MVTMLTHPYTLSDAVADYALCFAILALAAHAAKTYIWDADARWFFVHVTGNAFICFHSCGDVIDVFRDPDHALFRPADAMPAISYRVVTMIGAIHIFHALFYKLTAADIFHHVAFVIFNQVAIFWPLMSGWATSHNLGWGPAINALNFFVCGLPGGLDYLCLCWTKDGHMTRARQKTIQAALNVWCRCPGIIAIVTVILFECMRQWEVIPTGARVISLTAFILIGYNGLHYMEAVVASAGKKVEEFRGTC